MMLRSVVSGCIASVITAGCADTPDTKSAATQENAPVAFGMRDLPEDQIPGPEPGGLTAPIDDAVPDTADAAVERVRITRIPTAQIEPRKNANQTTDTSVAEEAEPAPPATPDTPTPPAPAAESASPPPTVPQPATQTPTAQSPPPPSPPPAPPPTPQIDLHFVGDEVHVTINGRPVAKQHVRRTDNAIEIIGTQGQVLQSIPIPQPPEHPPVMLGIRFEEPGEALVKHLGSDVTGCAVVVSVMPNGPGYRAGIEDFDIVTAVNGKAPATPQAIRAALQRTLPGQSITLTVRRGKVSKDFVVETVAWKHVPLPAELQPEPTRPVASPKIPGTPNMPTDTNDRGRPAAAPQRTATGG